ncbi:hypothetical protein PSQ19_11855 [Devosia algicola]|uniref:Uncharacterized protein n=1 Tax=Devosia algicola TaxID=3026418 RepID=A0ABY7YJL1_9HYPH|nr:hypothetical protein [Devosia algicola]WDR01493.1 hypothetical protein PSQ19_11855 [Devosia algicola]
MAAGQGLVDELDDFDLDFTPVAVDLGKDQTEIQAVRGANADQFEDAPLTDQAGHWEIGFVPHPALYARANDPLLLFREPGVSWAHDGVRQPAGSANVGRLRAVRGFLFLADFPCCTRGQ